MKKDKVNPTSIRIPEKTLERIDRLCDDNNCSRNDFITSILDEAVNNKVDETEDQKPKPIPKVIIPLNEPKPKLTLGTIKIMNNSKGEPTKYKLISINDNGIQLWNEI